MLCERRGGRSSGGSVPCLAWAAPSVRSVPRGVIFEMNAAVVDVFSDFARGHFSGGAREEAGGRFVSSAPAMMASRIWLYMSESVFGVCGTSMVLV